MAGGRAGARIAALLLACAAPGGAQTRTGTTLGQFLLDRARVRASPRSAMPASPPTAAGRRLLAIPPPRAAWRSSSSSSSTWTGWPASVTTTWRWGFRSRPWGTAFATLASLNSGDIDVRTVNQPLGTGELYSRLRLARLGWGSRARSPTGSAAGSRCAISRRPSGTPPRDAITFDVGTVYRISPDGLYIGSSITNFGTGAPTRSRDPQHHL